MATTYEVRMTVLDKGQADPSVTRVLEESLSTHGRAEVTSEPRDGGQGGDLARVRLWIDAQDSSEAQLAALDSVRGALAKAGLREPAVELSDPDVRFSS
jgi:hypothetical protein